MEMFWFMIYFAALLYADTYKKALLGLNYSMDDSWFDYYQTYSPYRGCIEIKMSELSNIWEDKVSVLTWETCRDHCFYYENTIAFLFDGDKCGCRGLSGFKTELINRRKCSLPCSGSFRQQCGGPAKDVLLQAYPAIQVQVCNPGYYGAGCAFPCSCKWLYPCDVVTGECGNGKVCARRFVHYTTSPKAFRCDQAEICPEGHYGIYCLYECHCKFGKCDRISGVCHQAGCSIGWLGGRCDKGDICISNPCKNRGKCERSSHGYVCHCPHGYVGYNCHIVDPCLSAPCQNGGTCRSKEELFECRCPIPFSGTICTLDYHDLEIISDYILCERSGDPSLGEQYGLTHRMIGDVSKNMTVQNCVRYCRIKNFIYAGLHDSNMCFCGNSHNSYGGLPMKYCNQPCNGNTSQMCGSFLAFSIHSTCPLGSYKVDCMLKCKCRGLMVQCDIITGKCPSGLCAFGYSGTQCDQEIPPPTITVNMILLMYQMTLILFPVLGIYSTLQTIFRVNEESKIAKLKRRKLLGWKIQKL